DGVEMTAAHFHNAATGLNGGVVRNIGPDFTGQTAWGLWTSDDDQPFTPALLNELIAGNLYVNVHSAANPGGEIRGQVRLNGGTGFAARIEGDQEVPPVATEASGTGAFTLTNAGLAFSITADALDFTAAHFHNAGPGTNGGVVRGITDDFGETTTAWGLWSPSDAQALTADQRGELIEGNIYVNLHTPENPGGEIRGQLGRPQFSTSVHYIGERDGADGVILYQNYPNPFSEATQIAFSIDRGGPVSIKIYNSSGEEVESIERAFTDAGLHTVAVKASGMSPGIYYYTLDFGPTRLTGKMSITK
ncbi:MAG: CHRD domain-containing protein, partial [Saprospiraceae bacterium]|nr:CHRD domain-containing protein [Saprospiraceae bacterium]